MLVYFFSAECNFNCTCGRISLELPSFGRRFQSATPLVSIDKLNSWYLPSDLPTFFFSLLSLFFSPFLLSRSTALGVPKHFPSSWFIHSNPVLRQLRKVFRSPSIKSYNLWIVLEWQQHPISFGLWFLGWYTLLCYLVEIVLPFPTNFTFLLLLFCNGSGANIGFCFFGVTGFTYLGLFVFKMDATMPICKIVTPTPVSTSVTLYLLYFWNWVLGCVLFSWNWVVLV